MNWKERYQVETPISPYDLKPGMLFKVVNKDTTDYTYTYYGYFRKISDTRGELWALFFRGELDSRLDYMESALTIGHYNYYYLNKMEGEE